MLGSAFHKATEQNYQQVKISGERLDATALSDAYNEAWESEVAGYGGVNEVQWDAREKADTVRLSGEAVTQLYSERVVDRYAPEATEHEFLLDLPGVAVPIKGFVDLLAENVRDDNVATGWVGVDYKTSARAQRTLKPGWKFQGEVYQLAISRPIEWHVVVKGSKPNVITPLDTSDLFQFEEPGTYNLVALKFRQTLAQISWLMTTEGPDNPWPTNGTLHDWACSWCSYKTGCVAWKRT